MFHFLEKLNRASRKLGHRLAGLGAAPIGLIERPFRAIGRALFSGSERFEDWMGNLGGALAWPFRALGRGLGKWTRLLLPESLRGLLAAPFRDLGRWSRQLGRWIVRAAEAVNLDRPVLWLVWLLQPVWRPIAAIGGFLHAWAETRNYKQMLWGLPAVVMLLPFLLVLVKTVVFGHASAASQYRLAVKEALEAKDYERSQLFERKLAQLGVDTQLTDYRTADTLARDGKLQQAYQRMQRLAPVEEPGYPSAHFWIVQRLFGEELDVPEDEALRLAGIHLQHIEALGFKGPEIQLLRAYWYTRQNRLTEAAEVLKPLESQLLEAATQRMQINIALKNQKESRRDALSVRRHMQDRQQRQGSVTSQQYQWWALAEEILGDPEKLIMVLQAWHENDPENQQARNVLANIRFRQLNQHLRSFIPMPDQIVRILFEIADLSTDPDIPTKLAETLYLQNPRITREVVDLLLLKEPVSTRLLVAMGTSAAQCGQYEQAQSLLHRALQQDANNGAAWNNYAWVLGHGPKADYDQALVAIHKALVLSPDESRFRETRGQILINLEQWQEAIADLEYAANGMPENKEIHQSLAKAYDALGEAELARMHEGAASSE
jgi:tetratricopeptide (TPR) repeat protein